MRNPNYEEVAKTVPGQTGIRENEREAVEPGTNNPRVPFQAAIGAVGERHAGSGRIDLGVIIGEHNHALRIRGINGDNGFRLVAKLTVGVDVLADRQSVSAIEADEVVGVREQRVIENARRGTSTAASPRGTSQLPGRAAAGRASSRPARRSGAGTRASTILSDRASA